MKVFSGYYRNDDEDLVDTQYDITVNSCGRYELVHQQFFRTSRPNGRLDFQLLYIAQGEAYFTLNDQEQLVTEGYMVIYYPGEDQIYSYYNTSSPIIYWIHFSGYQAYSILEKYQLMGSQPYSIGVSPELIVLFDRMISELNYSKTHFQEICRLYFKQWLALSARGLVEVSIAQFKKNNMLEAAIQYFNEHSNQPINIEAYAHGQNISCCWFIRSFKNYTGTTPAHYITSLRMNKAKSLLTSGSFTINQVASIVGYDNALYFSRMFKKYVGKAPRNYLSI